MKSFNFSAVFLCLGVLLFVSGCGGSGSGGSGGGSTSPAKPAVSSISPKSVPVGSDATTLTVTGTGFINSSLVQVGGTNEPTTYVSSTQLTASVPATQLTTGAQLPVTVINGTTSSSGTPINLEVDNPKPTLANLSMTSAIVGDPGTTIYIGGTGFIGSTVIQVNGSARPTSVANAYQLSVTLPDSDFSAAGTLALTAVNPTPGGGTSSALTITLTNPPVPTLSGIYPAGGPVNTDTKVTLNGTGFTPLTTAMVNGIAIPTTWQDSNQLNCTVPAALAALPGNLNITVYTPAPGGGTSSAQLYTTYLAIPNNDIVYNPADGLLYASVPVESVGDGGNSVFGIDPTTGSVRRTIWVGSNPNKLALSTDGTQLFVGLDGAGAVAQVDLTKGKVVDQFALGGGPGIYNPPYTAQYLAAVPGSPNSVAVSSPGSVFGGNDVTIYDSGVVRQSPSTGVGSGPISFGASASTLYLMNGATLVELTVGANGITKSATLANLNYQASAMQYDNGRLYLSSGQVVDAKTGTILGTFYSAANTPAAGALVSDAALGKAFIGINNFSSTGQLLAFDESTFNLNGSIPINNVGSQGYPTNFQKIVRWGQNGIAMSAAFSAFASVNQIYIFQSPLVKDLSSTPADLGVTLTSPATGNTGGAISWVAKVSNAGPNTADGVTAALSLDASLVINSVKASVGSCGTGAVFTCDLGTLASGASATVTVSATPTVAGTFAGSATVNSITTDPKMTDNQATSSTKVSGNLYGAVPSITSISPNFVQAGGDSFTLTVNGAGFNSDSAISLGSSALTTTYVSPTQLTTTVDSSQIANYGWAAVTVSNPSPGGGVSQMLPLTIYGLVNAPATALAFDPYSQKLYATIPSTSTTITGNSVAPIDPMTGTIGTPIAVGSQPTVMTETSDGKYLFVGLSGSDSLAQVDLIQQNLKATIPINMPQWGGSAPVAPAALAAMPGSDTTLAINAPGEGGTFGIFDINGNTGTFRPNFSGIYAGDEPIFADATHLYAYDNQTTGAEFYRYSVDANGVTQIDGTTLDGMGGFGGTLQLAGGLVYGTGGGIVNPSTTPPSQVAVLPQLDFYGSGSTGIGAGVLPDASLGKEFMMLTNVAGTWAYGLVRYDLTTYTPEALVGMPASASSVEAGWTMLRFGQDGLALLSSAEDFGTNQTVSVVMLIRGPFVTPQLLSKNSAATLTSSSVSKIPHGSSNTMLTLTGSNFLPGVAVSWNGSYRTTTRVDATHVTVAIPASDLTSAGTATLKATNPNAAASSALTLTIQ